ncbi:MAG: hypothetical protein UW78_C0020G0003 [Candidatus Azambacteria bacterium GW2011_GWA1_44_9]|uniref:Uncharacterized protein n=1 Tax=Candidatus Azambacteria bacterium GW2011_GWA1_44_9 TaxID=1618610 RepID=A0A0G1N9U7_9BACT|nr:MAG: hypothetical protein UW78_C0020G0003 [Candidatus Azambacteria bacterium GW2011_GWA1_44_9]
MALEKDTLTPDAKEMCVGCGNYQFDGTCRVSCLDNFLFLETNKANPFFSHFEDDFERCFEDKVE